MEQTVFPLKKVAVMSQELAEHYLAIATKFLLGIIAILALVEYIATIFAGLKHRYSSAYCHLAAAMGLALIGFYLYWEWVIHTDPPFWYFILGLLLGSPQRTLYKIEREKARHP